MMRKRKGYTVYPLTAAQKFHFFYLDACPNKAVVNIGTSLTIEAELDFDILRESILKAYERSEGMRIQFAKDDAGVDGGSVSERGFSYEPHGNDSDAGRI